MLWQVAVACVLAACVSTAMAQSGWPMAGGNPQRTSWTPDEVSGPLKPDWLVPLRPYVSRKVQVVAADDTLFISTAGGLYALDAATGAQKWLYPTEMPLSHSPTVVDGVAYVAGLDHKIHAVDARTGQAKWVFGPAEAGFQTNPLVSNGAVYAGNRGGMMYAVNAADGTEMWHYQAGGPILFSAAYAEGAIYFAAQDCRAYALDAANGELRWKSEKLPGAGFHSLWPVVYRDCIVLCGAPAYRPEPPTPGDYHDRNELHDVFPEYYPPGVSVEDALKREGPQNVPIGPYVQADGPWPANSRIMDASRAGEYFETKPWRRTVFLLNRADGKEITFDYDGDGKPSYAPFLYFGTKSGSRFTPAVDKRGALYITCNFLGQKHISRGAICGWSWGTTLLRPRGNWAIDEPMAYLIGGDSLYWQTCVDREAGAIPMEAGGDWPRYFSYGATNIYKQVPQLWYAGWDFGYHKHGDQNPPVPYKGRVYSVINNAVLAWAPDGKLRPGMPGPLVAKDLGKPLTELVKENVLGSLLWQVTADGKSWPTVLQQEVYYAERVRVGSSYMPILTVSAGDGQPAAVQVKPASFASVGEMVHAFGDGKALKTQAWRRTPTVLFENTGSVYRLQGKLSGVAYATARGVKTAATPLAASQATAPAATTSSAESAEINCTDLAESWLLIWADESAHRFSPMLVSLQNRPTRIALSGGDLTIAFEGPAGALTLTPLFGLSAPQPDVAEGWAKSLPGDVARRCEMLNRFAKCVQTGMEESFEIDPDGTVRLAYACTFADLNDAWRTPALRVALLPPELALAAYGDSPIRVSGKPLSQGTDLSMPVPMGRVAGVEGTDKLVVTLPNLAELWQSPLAISQATAPSAEDAISTRLAQQVQKILDAGHLRPGYAPARGDLMIEPGADYFRNPADTIVTLLRALPLLPKEMQPKVIEYVRREFEAYPPYKIAHIGYRDGAGRERYDLPPDVQDKLPAVAPVSFSEELPITPQSFYALAKYVEMAGSDQAKSLFAAVDGKLRVPDYWRRMALELQAQTAGHIGYLRLAKMAGADEATLRPMERRLVDVLIFRAARLKNLASVQQWGFEYASPKWDVEWYNPLTGDINFMPEMLGCLWRQLPEAYGVRNDVDFFHSGSAGFGYAFNVDFMWMTPEMGEFLRQYAPAETAQAVADYQRRAPLWFVSWAEEFGGEGTLMPLHDLWATFQAKAVAMQQPRSELEKYLDVPAFAVGDLYYIQNLCAVLEAK